MAFCGGDPGWGGLGPSDGSVEVEAEAGEVGEDCGPVAFGRGLEFVVQELGGVT